ncbi:MAG: hypothetical protein KJ668_15925, partial [Proteobacteria bacterium]|nr:hypothetical protein [Pseudomonadota bacterium]
LDWIEEEEELITCLLNDKNITENILFSKMIEKMILNIPNELDHIEKRIRICNLIVNNKIEKLLHFSETILN